MHWYYLSVNLQVFVFSHEVVIIVGKEKEKVIREKRMNDTMSKI